MPFSLQLLKKWPVDPSTPLLIIMFSASILLFSTCFATESIYFVEGRLPASEMSNFQSFQVTFGLFGVCFEGSGDIGKNCTNPRIGYQLDTLDLAMGNTDAFAASSLPALGALVLHLVTFIFVVFAMGIVILTNHKQTFLSRWILEITSFIAGSILVTFIVDLSLFYSMRTVIPPWLALYVGNGTWLTLIAFFMLFFGAILFKIHSRRVLLSIPPSIPLKDHVAGLEEGRLPAYPLNDKDLPKTPKTALDQNPANLKNDEEYKATVANVVFQPQRRSDLSPISSGGSMVAIKSPVSEPAPRYEASQREDFDENPPTSPSNDWNQHRESIFDSDGLPSARFISSSDGLPSSRLLPESEPDQSFSPQNTESSPSFHEQQSPIYAPSSYHTYRRDSSFSIQTGIGLEGGVSTSDLQTQMVQPSRASSCLNSPISGPKSKASRYSYRRSTRDDLSRSTSLASTTTSNTDPRTKRYSNKNTPQPSPLPIPKMPSMSTLQQLRNNEPVRPRIDTGHLQVYPPLITAFANASYGSLVSPTSMNITDTAMSTPQPSPIRAGHHNNNGMSTPGQ